MILCIAPTFNMSETMMAVLFLFVFVDFHMFFGCLKIIEIYPATIKFSS